MGIYIKGLQMPKGEFKSLDLSIDSDGKVYTDERDWFGQHTYNFLSEAIPAQDHGDLLDKDELSRLVGESFEYFLARLGLKCPKAVIPAERSEE